MQSVITEVLWNAVLKKTYCTDVCEYVCVVHLEQLTYGFVKTICARPVSSSETSGIFVIPLWTEVKWIRLMLFTIKAQYNNLTDSKGFCFSTKCLLVYSKNVKKRKWNDRVLNWARSDSSHLGRPSFLTEEAWKHTDDIFSMFCTVTLCAVTFWIVQYIPRIY